MQQQTLQARSRNPSPCHRPAGPCPCVKWFRLPPRRATRPHSRRGPPRSAFATTRCRNNRRTLRIPFDRLVAVTEQTA
eukprot:2553738-Lingulodinium_polyedra.AAC.1